GAGSAAACRGRRLPFPYDRPCGRRQCAVPPARARRGEQFDGGRLTMTRPTTPSSRHPVPLLRKRLSRRAVLRGACGAALGLPLLDAMVPALAQPGDTAATLRFGAVYVPNGIRAELFRPAPGPGLDLPPLLARLEPSHGYVNVISGLA